MFNIRPSIIKETIANRSFVIFALGATAATTRNNERGKVNFHEQLKKSWMKITFIVENQVQHGNTDLTTRYKVEDLGSIKSTTAFNFSKLEGE